MHKILHVTDIDALVSIIQKNNKKIVVAGGCFDILHVGHVQFLHRAKEHADVLIVLLESDERIKKIKGNHRPVNTQHDRAFLLAALEAVDYVVLLPRQMENTDYDQLISKIKPAIIATTLSDPGRGHKERQAQLVNSVVKDVIERIPGYSTSGMVVESIRK